jgi:hypothetical protein
VSPRKHLVDVDVSDPLPLRVRGAGPQIGP